MNCVELCRSKNSSCENKSCRKWIDYEEDLNCTHIAIDKHGSMTLRSIGKRLKVSFVRIKQIQDRALRKLLPKVQNLN